MSDRGRRTRRRGEELVKAIHDAVLEEVLEVGVARLTMDGIGRRAATPRTTLYRRWSSPIEVLLDALYHQHPMEEPTAGADDLRGDLVRALRLMADWAFSPAGRAVAAILTDPKSVALISDALQEQVFAGRGGRFTLTVLQHYAGRGHFPAELITPIVADIGEALVTKHLIDQGRPPTDEILEAIVDQAILPAIGFGPRAAAGLGQPARAQPRNAPQ